MTTKCDVISWIESWNRKDDDGKTVEIKVMSLVNSNVLILIS